MTDGEAAHAHVHGAGAEMEAPDVASDPVCGMKVNTATAKHRFEHDGHPFFFCSARCREKFIAAPESYLTEVETPPAPAPKGTIYTCPMHPADPAGRAGELPDLRHGAGAARCVRGGRTERRADRHEPPLLDRSRADAAGRGAGDGRPHSGAGTARSDSAAPRLSCCNSPSPRRSCCGPAGRSSNAPGPRSCIAA